MTNSSPLRTLLRPVVPRRAVLATGAAALARPAVAQGRPIRLVVPFGPGGITDIIARVVAEAAGGLLGAAVVVENRAGAGGNLAGEYVAGAAADGMTLLLTTNGMVAVNPAIYPRMPYEPLRDLRPVAVLATAPYVFVAHPRAGFSDLAGLLAAARPVAEGVAFSATGGGSAPHQAQILLQSLTGVELLTVHFRSGAASVQAVLAGQVPVTAEATAVVGESVASGALRGLAIAWPERVPLLAGVPTTAEAGWPGLTVASISGVMAPRGVPDAVVARLEAALRAAATGEVARGRFAALGVIAEGGSAEAFAAMARGEAARWAPLLRGVRAD